MNSQTVTAQRPLGSRPWKKEEEEYLEEKWGYSSVPSIAKQLNRTPNAIIVRAQRLGLGPALMNGDYITLNQLVIAVTGLSREYSYHLKSWVQNRGLPIHKKRVNKCNFKVVYLEEFWEWAEKNRSYIDFSRMQPNVLGEEPEWVKEQRRKDYYAFPLQRKEPWTPAEDSKLLTLLKQQKYGYKELAKILNRSEGAIQRRGQDLGTKYRPVKADNHGEESKWHDEDYRILADGIRNGDSYALIGNKIGKSEKAIRGKVYNVYFTESADKVRSMLQNGKWGCGAPVPTVKQARYVSGYSADVKKNLSALAGLLKLRMNELGYEPYWQRHMCMNWDDFEGCTAGCANCDSCAEFIRIKPQYCNRCGNTFYERKENSICKSCREARKRQAQKKWSILNNRQQRRNI